MGAGLKCINGWVRLCLGFVEGWCGLCLGLAWSVFRVGIECVFRVCMVICLVKNACTVGFWFV